MSTKPTAQSKFCALWQGDLPRIHTLESELSSHSVELVKKKGKMVAVNEKNGIPNEFDLGTRDALRSKESKLRVGPMQTHIVSRPVHHSERQRNTHSSTRMIIASILTNCISQVDHVSFGMPEKLCPTALQPDKYIPTAAQDK